MTAITGSSESSLALAECPSSLFAGISWLINDVMACLMPDPMSCHLIKRTRLTSPGSRVQLQQHKTLPALERSELVKLVLGTL